MHSRSRLAQKLSIYVFLGYDGEDFPAQASEEYTTRPLPPMEKFFSKMAAKNCNQLINSVRESERLIYCPVPLTANEVEPVAQLVVTLIAPVRAPTLVGVK